MSVLSSKLIAINIVDVSDGNLLAGHPRHVQHFDEDSRLQLLESQLQELKQWKASLMGGLTSTTLPAITEMTRSPSMSSGSSFSSIRSKDAEAVDSTNSSRTAVSLVKAAESTQKEIKPVQEIKPTQSAVKVP
jgi:hypothetical protein